MFLGFFFSVSQSTFSLVCKILLITVENKSFFSMDGETLLCSNGTVYKYKYTMNITTAAKQMFLSSCTQTADY